MKKIVIFLIGILVISCNQGKNEKSNKAESTIKLTEVTDDFDWLLGKWKRGNEEIGKETFENWDKKSNTEYVGFSYTTQKGDTIYQEKFRLVKSNTDWNFEIELKGETVPSTFKMTSSNTQEFICENNEKYFPNRKADSPNKIKYWTNKEKLYATISGKEIEIQFEFVKLN
jgi:hypothetical protein